MYDVMFWTGVVTWCALAVLGLFSLIDFIAEWLIDGLAFKKYVWKYLTDRRRQQ